MLNIRLKEENIVKLDLLKFREIFSNFKYVTKPCTLLAGEGLKIVKLKCYMLENSKLWPFKVLK